MSDVPGAAILTRWDLLSTRIEMLEDRVGEMEKLVAKLLTELAGQEGVESAAWAEHHRSLQQRRRDRMAKRRRR